MAAHVGDVTVMTCQGGCDVTAVAGSFLRARQRPRQSPLLFHPSDQRFGRVADTGDLLAVALGGDQKRRQPAVHTYPAGVVRAVARNVLLTGVQVGGLDVQRYPPPPAVTADGGETDFGPTLGEHAPQTAGVIMHSDWTDAGQRDRAGPAVIADTDRRWLALGMFVAQPKRRHPDGFLLETRKPDSFAFAIPRPGLRPAFQPLAQVDGGFFEHLLTHLVPPRQPGHHGLGDTAGLDSEDPAGVRGFLPRVERVDQIEPGPRNLHIRARISLFESSFDQAQALIERKPRRPRMSGQHVTLLDGGVEAELERGVPAHQR